MALTITCPICGKRNGYEFRFGGEERGARPDEEGLTHEQWCDYVHMKTNTGGIQEEWWYHRDGCGSWFKIRRNTLTNIDVENPATEEPCGRYSAYTAEILDHALSEADAAFVRQ